MAIEEPEELRGTSKHCTVCNADSTRHTFLYFNNRSVSQPRYVCICCNAEFTHGGKAYHKRKRSRDKQSRHPRRLAVVAASSPSSREPSPVREEPASPVREEPGSLGRRAASPAPATLADPVGRRASKRRRNREGASRELPPAAAAASLPELGSSSPPPRAGSPAPEASVGRVTWSKGKEGKRSGVKTQHSGSAAAGDESPPVLEARAPARSASAAPVRRSTRIAEAGMQREQGQRGTESASDVAEPPADVRQAAVALAGVAGPSGGGRGDDQAAGPSTGVRPVSAGPPDKRMFQIKIKQAGTGEAVRCAFMNLEQDLSS